MSKIKSTNNQLERRRPTFLKIGLIASLAFALMAFEYTTYGPKHLQFDDDIEVFTLEEELLPIKKMEKEIQQKEEPETAIKEEKKPTSLLEIEIATDIQTEEIGVEGPPDRPEVPTATPPIVVDPPEGSEGPVEFLPVGSLPYYKTCDTKKSAEERQFCTVFKFKEFVRDHIRIPRDITGEYEAFVYFVVDKKGKISDIKMLKMVPATLEEELVRLFEEMPELVPGHQRLKPVSVPYRMPIKVIRR